MAVTISKEQNAVPCLPSLAVMEQNPPSLSRAVPQDTPEGTEAHTLGYTTLSTKYFTQTHWFAPYNSLKYIVITPISNKETECKEAKKNW